MTILVKFDLTIENANSLANLGITSHVPKLLLFSHVKPLGNIIAMNENGNAIKTSKNIVGPF
jgi:hypothetical protein